MHVEVFKMYVRRSGLNNTRMRSLVALSIMLTTGHALGAPSPIPRARAVGVCISVFVHEVNTLRIHYIYSGNETGSEIAYFLSR